MASNSVLLYFLVGYFRKSGQKRNIIFGSKSFTEIEYTYKKMHES